MKVVTYNIQWSKGRDGRLDLGRIARAVGTMQTAVVEGVVQLGTRSAIASRAKSPASASTMT